MVLGGGTASGAPTTGAHVLGEEVTDVLGNRWFCTVAGTPGTWVAVGLHKIAQTVLAAPAATIDFSSIPATYETLILTMMGAGTNASTAVTVSCRLNNDSGATYDWSNQTTGGNSWTNGDTSFQLGGFFPGANAQAADSGAVDLLLPSYARTTLRKTIHGRQDGPINVDANNIHQSQFVGSWHSTAAVNQITLRISAGNYAIGSVATLYGRP